MTDPLTAIPIPDALAAVRTAAARARESKSIADADAEANRLAIRVAHFSGARIIQLADAADVSEGRIHQIVGPVRNR